MFLGLPLLLGIKIIKGRIRPFVSSTENNYRTNSSFCTNEALFYLQIPENIYANISFYNPFLQAFPRQIVVPAISCQQQLLLLQVFALCSTEKIQIRGYKPLCRPGTWNMDSVALRMFRSLATSPLYGPGT